MHGKKSQIVLIITQSLFCFVPTFNSSNSRVFPCLYFKEYFNVVFCQHRLSKVENNSYFGKSRKWVSKLFAIKIQYVPCLTKELPTGESEAVARRWLQMLAGYLAFFPCHVTPIILYLGQKPFLSVPFGQQVVTELALLKLLLLLRLVVSLPDCLAWGKFSFDKLESDLEFPYHITLNNCEYHSIL